MGAVVVTLADVVAAFRVVEVVVGFLVVVGEWDMVTDLVAACVEVLDRAWVVELAGFGAEDTVVDEKGRCDVLKRVGDDAC